MSREFRASEGVQAARGSDEFRQFAAAMRQRLAGRLSQTALPTADTGALSEVDASADLPACFAAAAASAGWNVRCVVEAECASAVADIVKSCGAARVLLRAEPGTALTPEHAAAIGRILADRGVAVTTERDDDTMFAVDAAITGASAAIAETGTIVCVSGADVARGASLIPPVHIALIAAAQIVPDLFDYFARAGAARTLAANINLITGPSKTADIEGILVTGVHGPGHVHVVVLGERPVK